MLRLVMVDDHHQYRESLAQLLDAEPDLAVVGQGRSADEAVQLAHELAPDVIILDLGMPGNGLAAAETIAQASSAARVVLLTSSDDPADIMRAEQVGAAAYLVKGVGVRQVVEAVRSAADPATPFFLRC